MAFTARWFSSGVGYNGAGLLLSGASSYLIKWGHGANERVSEPNYDSDADGELDSIDIFHLFPSDGNYDIEVSERPNVGQPPIRLKAFLAASQTNDLVYNTSRLDDMVITGSGNDRVSTADGNDWVSASGGNDHVRGNNGDDFLLGGAGDDRLRGDAGSDLLAGGSNDDELRGGDDGDSIYGDAGADDLFGDAGDDFLQGGTGRDRLTGGAGADIFAFARPRDDAEGVVTPGKDLDNDVIRDFTQGEDRINVWQWAPNGFDFIDTDRFSGNGFAELRYVQKDSETMVYLDTDGDRVVDLSFKLHGSFDLKPSDFGILDM